MGPVRQAKDGQQQRGGMGPPITYQLDGKQYIALMGGTGVVKFGFFGPPGGAPPTSPPPKPRLYVYTLEQ